MRICLLIGIIILLIERKKEGQRKIIPLGIDYAPAWHNTKKNISRKGLGKLFY